VTKRWKLISCFAIVAAVSQTRAASNPDVLRPAVLETFFRLRVLAAAVDTLRVNRPAPGPTAGLVPIASVLDREFIAERMLRASLRDAWGRPILYWSDGADYVVISYGSDGRAQFDYSGDPPYSDVPNGWAGSDPTDDLIIVDGVAYRGPSSQSELVRRAMSDMHSAGTACESFAVDNNIYPGPVDPTDVLARIASDLQPIYIRTLPTIDPWGHPYLFWSNQYAYAIVSYGVDGRPDYPYATWGLTEFEALSTGAATRLGTDLVFVNYRFVQWPGIGINP
jgi:Type II secretion system (T2SS), protein G